MSALAREARLTFKRRDNNVGVKLTQPFIESRGNLVAVFFGYFLLLYILLLHKTTLLIDNLKFFKTKINSERTIKKFASLVKLE